MWFLERASSGLLQSNNLRERTEEKQGYWGQSAGKCLNDLEFTFNCKTGGNSMKGIHYSDT